MLDAISHKDRIPQGGDYREQSGKLSSGCLKISAVILCCNIVFLVACSECKKVRHCI